MSRLPAGPVLMLVTDQHRSRLPLPEAVAAAVEGGVDLVQVREPDLPDDALTALVTDLADHVGHDRIVVNGRPELAGRLGTGVHLRDGQSIPPTTAGWPLLGRSVHAPANGEPTGGAYDYLLAGNVFATRTHPGRLARGTGWLGGVVAGTNVPVLAIGGITPDKVPEVMATGCRGVAVVDAILAADDPATAAQRLRAALDATRPILPEGHTR